MSADLECADISLPVEKMSLNFPNEKNYIQRNYECLQMNQICSDKFHTSLEILQTHLQTAANFCLTKPEIDNAKYQVVKHSILSDIVFLETIIPLLDVLIKSQEIEQKNLEFTNNKIESKIKETGIAISQIIESK